MDISSQTDDSWWIDFLENELDPLLDKDVQLLLEHSSEDRDSFESFRLVKQWIKESDPVRDWPIDERLKRMRSRIMEAIADAPVEVKPAPVPKSRVRRPLDHSASP